MTFEERIDTDAAPDKAFAYLADWKNLPVWDPMIPHVEQITPGPVGVGTRFAVTLSVFGISNTFDYHVENYEPLRKAVMMGSGTAASIIDTISVTSRGKGSRVRWKAEIKLWGPLQLLDPVTTWMFRPAIRLAVHNLGRELDALAAG